MTLRTRAFRLTHASLDYPSILPRSCILSPQPSSPTPVFIAVALLAVLSLLFYTDKRIAALPPTCRPGPPTITRFIHIDGSTILDPAGASLVPTAHRALQTTKNLAIRDRPMSVHTCLGRPTALAWTPMTVLDAHHTLLNAPHAHLLAHRLS